MCLIGLKSKLGPPRVIIELDKSLNHSPQGGLEKIGYMSSNGPPRNCCKIWDKYLIRHVPRWQNVGSTERFSTWISSWNFLYIYIYIININTWILVWVFIQYAWICLICLFIFHMGFSWFLMRNFSKRYLDII